jgi:hypothetical protein
MKPWLRLTIITVTVGGGFCGAILAGVALDSVFSQAVQSHSAISFVMMSVTLGLFILVTISGLIFAQHPERMNLLIWAFALQVPWVSVPHFGYRFAAGFDAAVAFFGGHFKWGISAGSNCQIQFFQQPLGAGINLFALIMLILLLRAKQKPLENTTFKPTVDTLDVLNADKK